MRSRKPQEDVAGSRWGQGLTEGWKRETGLFFPSLLDFHALLELQPRDEDIPGPRDLKGDVLEDLIYTSARHCLLAHQGKKTASTARPKETSMEVGKGDAGRV